MSDSTCRWNGVSASSRPAYGSRVAAGRGSSWRGTAEHGAARGGAWAFGRQGRGHLPAGGAASDTKKGPPGRAAAGPAPGHRQGSGVGQGFALTRKAPRAKLSPATWVTRLVPSTTSRVSAANSSGFFVSVGGKRRKEGHIGVSTT